MERGSGGKVSGDGPTGECLRWGLIGASDIAARRMLPALRSAGQDVWRVYSSDPEWGREFAARHGIPEVANTLSEAVADGVDAIYVSSKNDRHAGDVLAAAAAGRHVLCEKPLATGVEDAVSMVSACKKAGVVLATNHHLRNAALVGEVSRIVCGGGVGEVLAARVGHAIALPERLRSWRVRGDSLGSGVVFDIAVHDVDTVRFVLGQEVVEVVGMTAMQGLGSAGAEDASVSCLRMANGALVTMHQAFTVPFAGTSLQVDGTSASVIARDILSLEAEGELELRDSRGRQRLAREGAGDVYGLSVRAFVETVYGRGVPTASGQDGVASLAVAIAMRESAKSGKRVRVEYGLYDVDVRPSR